MPPSLEGTLLFPSNPGGVNWEGASYDSGRGLLIAQTNRIALFVRLIPRAEYDTLRSTYAANRMTGEFGPARHAIRDVSGVPAHAKRDLLRSPPWGTLTAVDLGTGKTRWEVPLGTMPQLSALPGSAQWGSVILGGSVVTGGGLVFIAAAMDNFLRAFDIETGRELAKWELPAGGQATPMTYQLRKGGKQFVVICAGGHGKMGTKIGDYVVAFALP